MYNFLNKITPDHFEAICAIAQMEMLEAGYSGVSEFHYLHNDLSECAIIKIQKCQKELLMLQKTELISHYCLYYMNIMASMVEI